MTKEEGDRLLAENAALRLQIRTLLEENAELRKKLNAVSDKQETLLELAAGQNERLSELTDLIRRRLQRAPAKEGEDPDDDDDPGAAPAEADVEALLDGKRPRRSRRGGRRGGRRQLGKHLPKATEDHAVDCCAGCGGHNLRARDVEVSEKLDIVRAYPRRRVIRREVKSCADCGATTTAAMPPMPCPKAGYTCELLAWLVVQHFVLLVPLNRIRRVLETQGIEIPKGTLSKLVERAADLLAAIDGEHWKELKAGRWIALDATGLQVRIDGLPTTWLGYLDVFDRGHLTVYQFVLTKHGDELERKLGNYEGILVCDAESRHNALFSDGRRVEAHCNAHARRKFEKAEKAQPVLAKKAGAFLTEMYEVEADAKKRGLSGDALLAERQGRTRPIATRFVAYLNEIKPTLLPSDPLRKAIRYYLKRLVAFTRFIDDPDLPIDNNSSERAFQDHARLRLNSLFAGSVEGAHRWAILLGIVETARRLGLDVYHYLVWALERRGTWRKRFGLAAAQLTPAAYKQMLEERNRSAA